MSDRPAPPQTEIESVENSGHKHEIFHSLASGWSPTQVHRFMERRFGLSIPLVDIIAFDKLIPEEHRLSDSEIKKGQKYLDVMLDLDDEIASLYLFMKARLDDAVLLEKITKQQGHSEQRKSGRPAREADTLVGQRFKVLWDCAMQLLEHSHKLRTNQEPSGLAPQQIPKTLRSLIDEGVVDAQYTVQEDGT